MARPALALLMVAGAFVQAADIHDAVKGGDPARVAAILEADPAQLEARDGDGRTPLHWAAREGSLAMLTLLADRGAALDSVDAGGVAALHTLAARGDLAGLRLLLERGADPRAATPTLSTPLHLAARSGRVDLLAPLVAAGADLEARDDYGRTPLVIAAREMAGIDTVRALLDLGAAVDSVDARDDTALALAVWRGTADVVDLLLERGAVIPAGRRQAVLAQAADKGLDRLFLRLVREGESPSEGLLAKAAGGGSVPIVEALLARGLRLDVADANGWTPLHFAADMGRGAVIGLLLDRGATLEARTVMGQTAYNVAQDNGDQETMALLTERGASAAPALFPALEGAYLGQEPPGLEPVPFAPGIVHGHHALHANVVFSPDGRQALWSISIPPRGAGYGGGRTLVTQVGEDGRWSYPRRAVFADVGVEDVPCFHPDGSALYDMARRLPGGGESGDENIWRWPRTAGGWGSPALLEGTVNELPQHWQFGVDRAGDLVLSTTLPDSAGGHDLYLSRLQDGRYGPPENLGPAINSPEGEDSPYLSADGRTLLFSRATDLFVSFRTAAGAWTTARAVSGVNTAGRETMPVLSPDGEHLFFCRDWRPYWVGAAVLDEPRELAGIEQVIRDSIGWALTKDRALLESTLAQDERLVIVNPSAETTVGWQQFARNFEVWMDPRFKAVSVDIHELRIDRSRSGDVAWWSCVLDDLGEWDGRPVGWEDTRWTGVLERRDGQWRIVQMHFSFARPAG